MKITRRYTTAGVDPLDSIAFEKRNCRIRNPDGTVVFAMENVEVPRAWSQLASDVLISKYFRKAGIPQSDEHGHIKLDEKGNPLTGPERSIRQVVGRLAGCWRHWGEKHDYFDCPSDAQAFEDEIRYMLVTQVAAPNSPQWFNTGLHHAYGLTGPSQGHFYADPVTGEIHASSDAYTHPQPHACFIQSIRDDLVNEGGIMDLWVREARLFKYGSGTGTNFSTLRGEGEPLSGGGSSSGLMSWLKIGDVAAGAIKSGGTTRRAAKMVCLDVDHPDIEKFINWKAGEEKKVAALAAAGYSTDFNGEAYQTVSGQNSNNSVRVSSEFLQAVEEDRPWQLRWRSDPSHVSKTLPARELWGRIADAAWRCADPGLQFDTTINQWHTCPASGRINASNPCSEYMFLDDTACNLASLNLMKFYDKSTGRFDVEGYRHAVRLWTIVLEISVLMAQYPAREIARRSFEFRTLGLGYANLGTLLMVAGIPYDSDAGRAVCGALTAILTGEAYAASAEMAAQLGPFQGYYKNKAAMQRVIRNHRHAVYNAPETQFEQLDVPPVGINPAHLAGVPIADGLLDAARSVWDRALEDGDRHGYRNAQVSVIAPTGTIGLLMDCDTTGVEPDFSLVKFKKLAGGGYFKIANQSVAPALRTLGYDDTRIRDIMRYVMGAMQLDDTPHVNTDALLARGFTAADLRRVEDELPGVFDLTFAFSPAVLGEDCLKRLGLPPELYQAPGFNFLQALGFTNEQIAAANDHVCGMQTIEGAPHLRPEHLPVFDCANPCGRIGKRFIHPHGHVRMMAAAQSFISGAISKTINLPNDTTVEEVQEVYRLSWKLGLKAVALYRDGCKLSQPLSAKSDTRVETDQKKVSAARATSAAEVSPSHERREPSTHAASSPSPQHQTPASADAGRAQRPARRRLPATRYSITHKFDVAGHEGYLTVGLYEDGQPGELFITMAKEGSTVGGLMDAFGTCISMALQYGVPLQTMVDKFAHARFEPAGMTRDADIPFAKSVIDYIARWLGMTFIEGYREANAPRREAGAASPLVIPRMDGNLFARQQPAIEDVPGDVHELSSGNAATSQTSREIFQDVATGRVVGPVSMPASTVHPAPGIVHASLAGLSQAALLRVDALSAANSRLMGDAPPCDVCGAITVRNGTCYKCVNCGNSMGCS